MKGRAMRKSGLLSCAVSVAALLAGLSGAAGQSLTPFRYQDQAQRHCPADSVVWLDFRKGRYYARGQKLYGRGFDGSYVCREEARSSFCRRALLGSR